MALLRDYELPGTGVTISDCYHVVTKVDVEKRISDIEGPPDSGRADGVTAGSKEIGKELYWKAGYIGKIAVTVWKDESARLTNARPLGFMGVNPSDDSYGASIGTDGMDHVCKFFIDTTSSKNHIEQAYDHLKTTAYYSNCTEI